MRRLIALTSLLALALPACRTASTGDTTPATPVGPGVPAAEGAPVDQAPTAQAAAELPPFPEEPFRASQPAAGPDRPFQLPAVKRFAMGPKIDVYLIEDHDLPVVSLDLNVDGGSMTDPAGKVGLADLCMDLLTEGTERLDKVAYSEALADLASNVSSYAGFDRQGVAMSSLKRNFAPTFALFAETITTPGFRAADFDRLVKRSLEALKQAKASPDSIRARVLPAVLFGTRHPFGQVVTEQTLGALRLDDCRAYHKAYLAPTGARLFVTGDITEAELRAAFEPLLATWKASPKKVARAPRPRSLSGKVFFVHVPGAAQSSVALMHLGPKRTSPHYFANQLMAQLLGGGFASRINMNLREHKGYSYGARGGFTYVRDFGEFSASSSVRTDATAQSIVELHGETQRIKDGSTPPKDEELAREKNAAILGLPSSFATAQETLGQFRTLVYFGLPLDYYSSYVEKVNGVTLDAVAKAARRELRPGEAFVVVVGDGDAPQITYDESVEGKSPPMVGKDGKPLTLRQALAELAASGKLGKVGKVVELDADARVVKPAKAAAK